MRNILLGVAVLAFFIAARASACTPAPAGQFFAQSADFVSIGTATGTRQGTREENFELFVTYAVQEVLLGKAPETLSAISPCRLPIRKGERLVIGRVHGQQYAYPAHIYEQDVRESMRNGR